jgi:hypothetical protein
MNKNILLRGRGAVNINIWGLIEQYRQKEVKNKSQRL